METLKSKSVRNEWSIVDHWIDVLPGDMVVNYGRKLVGIVTHVNKQKINGSFDWFNAYIYVQYGVKQIKIKHNNDVFVMSDRDLCQSTVYRFKGNR